MTWRGMAGATRNVMVWLLPTGRLIGPSGAVYLAGEYLPGYDDEAPGGGIEFPDKDTLRTTIIYQGQRQTVTWKRSPTPFARDTDDVTSAPGEMILVGSGPYALGRDVRLRYNADTEKWEHNVSGDWLELPYSLGSDKGGSIMSHVFAFPGAKYPESSADDNRIGNVFSIGG